MTQPLTVNSASVFKEDVDIVPTVVDDSLSYIPWGGDNLQLIDRMGDNQMPFDLLALVEKDEALTTCQWFNAEGCYGVMKSVRRGRRRSAVVRPIL
ncbi:MAG: hypothetical protein K2L85_03990 [Paramuribaculum sp.]|nr:hypothetical protein [Paramuribaculum sp.]